MQVHVTWCNKIEALINVSPKTVFDIIPYIELTLPSI